MDSAPAIAIRPLTTIAEMHLFEAAEREIWPVPGVVKVYPEPELLLTIAHNGGLVLGAWDGDTLAGILFGFLGRAPGGPLKHCSHLMGVRPAYRGHGIGQALKWAQRAAVQAQGLALITWTYDPLETPNARLNLHDLGAICRTYQPNLYGAMPDGLNAGLPSDRFAVEWWLDAPGVQARAGGRHPAWPDAAPLVNPPRPPDGRGWPRPGDWTLWPAAAVLVAVPADFRGLRRTDPTLALAWRLHTRAVFARLFAAGYVAEDVRLVPEQQQLWYLGRREAHHEGHEGHEAMV
jgi:predicted GNAT superfamily acetyltransferase